MVAMLSPKAIAKTVIIAFLVSVVAAMQVGCCFGITRFSPSDTFTIQASNGSVSFSRNGYYESLAVQNNTLMFRGLVLEGSSSLLGDVEKVSGSATFGALDVAVKDCNITITNFDLLPLPPQNHVEPSGPWVGPGQLNYPVTGNGVQVFGLHYNNVSGGYGPGFYSFVVYIDGAQEAKSYPPPLPAGIVGYLTDDNAGVVTISGANHDVCIKYQGRTSIEPGITQTQLLISEILFIILVCGVIVALAVLVKNRLQRK
jgi:hypothetical protein